MSQDLPLPEDLAAIAAEAEKLVAEAIDADAKQVAAKAAVQNAVQQIVDAAQLSIIRLHSYLSPGSPPPLLAILWPGVGPAPQPVEVAPNPQPAPEPPAEPAPVVEVGPVAVEPVAEQVDDFPVGAPEEPEPAPVVEQPPAPPAQLELIDQQTAEPVFVNPQPEPAPAPEPVVSEPAPLVAGSIVDGVIITQAMVDAAAQPAPAVEVVPVEPVGGEVAPQEPAFPVVEDVAPTTEQPVVADGEVVSAIDPTPVQSDEPAAEQPVANGDIINNG
jgi:hypothetical protein